MTRPTPKDPFANIPPDGSDENDERERRMEQSIAEMARTPGSGIAMCHEQGKTAVYPLRRQDVHRRAPSARSHHAHAARRLRRHCAVSDPRLTVVIGGERCRQDNLDPQASRDSPQAVLQRRLHRRRSRRRRRPGASARRPQARRRTYRTRPRRRQHLRIREHLFRTVTTRRRANRQTARLHDEGRLPRNRNRCDQYPPRTQASGGRGTPRRRERSQTTLDSGMGEPPRNVGRLRCDPGPRQLRDRAHRDRTQDQARSRDGRPPPTVGASVAGNGAEGRRKVEHRAMSSRQGPRPSPPAWR